MATLSEPVGLNRSFCEAITSVIVEAVSEGMPVKWAAAKVGCSPATVWKWRERGERALVNSEDGTVPEKEAPYVKFLLDMQAARAEAISRRIGHIEKAGKEGAWQASAWYLERQLPEEFGQVSRHELTGAQGGAIQIGQAEIMKQAEEIVAKRLKELNSGE